MPDRLIRSGALDRRITLQRRSVSQDGFGGVVESWSTLATVAAEREQGSGREAYTAGAERGEATATYRMWWLADLKVEDRLVDGAEVWDIIDVEPMGRRVGLRVTGKRAQA